jgi:hypothetical protein
LPGVYAIEPLTTIVAWCTAGSDFWAVKSSLGQFVAAGSGLDIRMIHNRKTSRSVAECASKILRKGQGELTIGLGTH